jgi:hypothetical protein
MLGNTLNIQSILKKITQLGEHSYINILNGTIISSVEMPTSVFLLTHSAVK